MLGALTRPRPLSRLLTALLVAASLLLLLINSGQYQQQSERPDLTAFLRTVPPRPIAQPPRASVQQRLRSPPPAALRDLTLGQVMTELHGSTDLELVRQGRLPRPNACPPRALIPWAGGRTGNLVFEYMAAYALARWNNLSLLIPDHMIEEFEGVFPQMSAQRGDLDFLMMDCAAAWEGRQQLGLGEIEDAFLNVPEEGGWVQVIGFPVNVTPAVYQQVHARAAEIRRELRFSDAIRGVVQTYLWRVRRAVAASDGDITFVGVHARRTDYKSAIYNMFGIWLSPPAESYFRRAMQHYRQRYSNVVFLVVSDDMRWCREHLSTLEDVVLFPGGNSHPALLDLALLANCNHTVMTYGTFALTGALLAGGETVLVEDPNWEFEVWKRQKEFWPAPWTQLPVTDPGEV